MSAVSVWPIGPIAQCPQVTLRGWAAFEVPLRGDQQPWTLHLVGYALETDQAQVCSAVKRFDPHSAKCLTVSGRIYELDGTPGLGRDAAYVWEQWKRVARIGQEREVTERIWDAIEASGATPGRTCRSG